MALKHSQAPITCLLISFITTALASWPRIPRLCVSLCVWQITGVRGGWGGRGGPQPEPAALHLLHQEPDAGLQLGQGARPGQPPLRLLQPPAAGGGPALPLLRRPAHTVTIRARNELP